MASCPDAAQHPGNNYYVQQVTGTIQRASGLTARILTGPLGYHGPFDWCDAKAYAAAHTESGAIHSPGQVGKAVAQEAGQGAGQLLGLGNLHWSGAANFMIRAVKITVGGVLLVAGIMRLTGTPVPIPPVAAAARRLPGMR